MTSEKLRVLFLPPQPWLPGINSYRPDAGPNPSRLFELMKEHGVEASVLDPYPFPWNPFVGRGSLWESLDLLRGVRVLLGKRSFDLIVSVFEGSAVVPLALRSFAAFKAPIALWDIGLTEKWRTRERILDFVVPRADGIFVLSGSQEPYIISRWKPRAAVKVISHRVDTAFYRPMPGGDGPLLSVGDDVGRDFETLIGAAKIAGSKLVIKTRQNLPPTGAESITVMREWLSHKALRDLYANSSIVVAPLLPSINASGVSTILEAGAMAKPLIVTDSESIRDFIVPGETCLMVPPRDPDALAAAIKMLSQDAALRSRLGRSAREHIERHFGEEPFARRFADSIKQVILSSVASKHERTL